MNKNTDGFILLLNNMNRNVENISSDLFKSFNWYDTSYSYNIAEAFNINCSEESEWDTARKSLRWVWEKLSFNDVYENTPNYDNLIQFIKFACKNKKSLNCYMRANILFELLHNFRIPARLIYFLPLNFSYNGNHVVVEAYITKINKWVLIDPSFNVYFKNHNNQLLSAVELKELILNNKDVVICDNSRFKSLQRDIISLKKYYINMIIPLLGVLQFQGKKDIEQFIRLTEVTYYLPLNVIENEKKEGIIYTTQKINLYEN